MVLNKAALMIPKKCFWLDSLQAALSSCDHPSHHEERLYQWCCTMLARLRNRPHRCWTCWWQVSSPLPVPWRGWNQVHEGEKSRNRQMNEWMNDWLIDWLFDVFASSRKRFTPYIFKISNMRFLKTLMKSSRPGRSICQNILRLCPLLLAKWLSCSTS